MFINSFVLFFLFFLTAVRLFLMAQTKTNLRLQKMKASSRNVTFSNVCFLGQRAPPVECFAQ